MMAHTHVMRTDRPEGEQEVSVMGRDRVGIGAQRLPQLGVSSW